MNDRDRGGALSPVELRELLVDTGVPQGDGDPIGPFVDLRAALRELSPLFLAASPLRPGPGSTIRFEVEKGAEARRVLLRWTELDGQELGITVATGRFDGAGRLAYDVDLPDDDRLSGLGLGFTAIGVTARGEIAVSNELFLEVR